VQLTPPPSPPPLPNKFDTGTWWPLAVLCAVILMLAVAAYTYGIPLASRMILAAVPLSIDRAIGDVFFESMDGTTLAPSRLDTPSQARLRAAFDGAVSRADGGAL
jgi:hypothetical protein